MRLTCKILFFFFIVWLAVSTSYAKQEENINNGLHFSSEFEKTYFEEFQKNGKLNSLSLLMSIDPNASDRLDLKNKKIHDRYSGQNKKN